MLSCSEESLRTSKRIQQDFFLERFQDCKKVTSLHKKHPVYVEIQTLHQRKTSEKCKHCQESSIISTVKHPDTTHVWSCFSSQGVGSLSVLPKITAMNGNGIKMSSESNFSQHSRTNLVMSCAFFSMMNQQVTS